MNLDTTLKSNCLTDLPTGNMKALKSDQIYAGSYLEDTLQYNKLEFHLQEFRFSVMQQENGLSNSSEALQRCSRQNLLHHGWHQRQPSVQNAWTVRWQSSSAEVKSAQQKLGEMASSGRTAAKDGVAKASASVMRHLPSRVSPQS